MSYTITEGQLVLLHHGVPEQAWTLPDSDRVRVESVEFEDLTGWNWVDMVTLSDGRCVVIDREAAALYRSVQAVFDCEPNEELYQC